MGDPQPAKDSVTEQPRTRCQRVRRFLLRRLIAYPLLYVGVVLVLLALEKSLVFYPASPAESWETPVDPRTQDVWFTDAIGAKLHGWWLPPNNPGAGAVLVAHGNGGNVSGRGALAWNLHRTLDAGVLLFDYPGYGKSEGKPDEAGCYSSGDAAFKWLTEVAKIPSNQIVLLGESLGGGTAVELATRHEHRALVLVFTFTSLPAAAKFHYPWLPTQWLMRTRFDNLAKIKQCPRPVFIAHGTADEVIPFHHGETLFAAANEPKEFFPMGGATHNILLGDDFYAALARFLAEKAP
jgi:fermentation-respiration switch protein FrsA (DUF1100 family)